MKKWVMSHVVMSYHVVYVWWTGLNTEDRTGYLDVGGFLISMLLSN